MSRAFVRIFVVALVALALGLATVTPASAGPAQVRRPAPVVTAGWLAQAWAVLQGWLTGAPGRPVSAAKADTVTLTKSPTGGVMPMTGACIDPMGHPVPCGQGW